MKNYFKIMLLLFLLVNVRFVFAEDWISFPTENRNIYPIVFGKIEDPDNLINCSGNFTASKFYPGQSLPQINIYSTCKNLEAGKLFFIRNKDATKDVQILVAKDFFKFYFISSTLKYGEQDQNISLTFPFKQS